MELLKEQKEEELKARIKAAEEAINRLAAKIPLNDNIVRTNKAIYHICALRVAIEEFKKLWGVD